MTKRGGAEHFEKILAKFSRETAEKGIKSALSWMAVDGSSLMRAAQPLKGNNPELFQWLLDHATFASLSSSGAAPIVIGLLNELSAFGPNVTLTTGKIISAETNASYDLHYQPPADNGRWPNGSYCERLTTPLKWLDQIVRSVNICHDFVLNESKELENHEAYQYLSEMRISVSPLRSLFNPHFV